MNIATERLRGKLVNSGLNQARVFYEAWGDGEADAETLRELIPSVGLYMEWPESDLGAGRWLELFHAAGFVSYRPGEFRAPDSNMTVYRAGAPDRSPGMAWTTERAAAVMYQKRRQLMAARQSPPPPDTAIFVATVTPAQVLAMMRRTDDQVVEVVVDPTSLSVEADASRT
jgi:hypothetical protein